MSKRVIVIGGGIAGLSAAWDLQKKGYKVRVLESEPVAGGRMRSLKWNNHWFDLGAVQVSNKEVELHAVANELGLTPRMQPYKGGKVDFEMWRDDRQKAYYFDSARIATSGAAYGALSWAGKMRCLKLLPDVIKQFRVNKKYKVSSSDTHLAAWADDESMETWLSRENQDLLEYFFEPWWEKMLTQPPHLVTKAIALFCVTHHSGATTWTWDEGVALVPRTMASKLDVVTNAVVTSFDVSKRPYEIEYSVGGETRKETADGVVVATPGNKVLNFLKGLDDWRQKYFENVQYKPYDRLYLKLKKKVKPFGVNYRYWCRNDDPELMMMGAGDMIQPKEDDGSMFMFGKLRGWPQERMRMNGYTERDVLEYTRNTCLRRVPELRDNIEDEFIWRGYGNSALACFPPGQLKANNKLLYELPPIPGVDFCGDYTSFTTTGSASSSGFRAGRRVAEQLAAM